MLSLHSPVFFDPRDLVVLMRRYNTEIGSCPRDKSKNFTSGCKSFVGDILDQVFAMRMYQPHPLEC